MNARNQDARKLLRTVRKINSTWIVHGDLDKTAEAYIAHLESNDPARLTLSLQAAMDAVTLYPGDSTDPKSLFYPALFSFASRLERINYLARHPFTRRAISSRRRSTKSNPGMDDCLWNRDTFLTPFVVLRGITRETKAKIAASRAIVRQCRQRALSNSA